MNTAPTYAAVRATTATCNGYDFFFDTADQNCAACPANAARVSGRCVCNAGYAHQVDSASGTESCVDCAAQKMMVSTSSSLNGSSSCLPCGGDTQLGCLTDSAYNATARACTCSTGMVLVQQVGTLLLTGAMCATCNTAACARCTLPYTWDAVSGACSCSSGYTTLYDASCVPTDEYQSMVTAAASSSVVLAPPNIDNGGAAGTATTISAVQTYAVGAAVLCKRGNHTACEMLANLCVLMDYQATATPCVLYRTVKQSKPCADQWCETANGFPWLYYTRSNALVLSDTANDLTLTSREQLQFVLSVYDLYGNWLGYEAMIDQVNPCFLANTQLERFTAAGGTRVTRCNVNWCWFLHANDTLFYEVFVRDPTNTTRLVDVPVLIDYTDSTFRPHTFSDAWLYRGGGSTDGTPPVNGFRRRFYAYDNVGGRDPTTLPAINTTYVTALWSASVVLGLSARSQSHRATPLLVLQFASKMTSTMTDAAAADSLRLLRQSPLSATAEAGRTVRCEMHSYFLLRTDSVSNGMKITLIVVSALCFVSAWLRVYGWMRRRQYLVLDWLALLRFFVYLCNHISNMFFVVVAVASWYVFIAYKEQFMLSRAMMEKDVYINAMLYTAVVTKAVAVLYRLVEQCNADYFVIDWERSKGQLLRENKIVPVSMWRSTFVANELNELQALRYWHPLLTMAIILLFLVGLEYMNMSASVPQGSRHVGGMTETFETLRIAIDTFFWIAVALVMYLLEFQVFYRFVVVHPLQAFIDLCSVSNVSIMILLEQQWGFYIHGESIHAHADVSMQEFQHNLFLEAQGNLPVRGLGGLSKSQAFEVYLGPYTRQYLYMCYMEMQLEHLRSLGKREKLVNPAQWHYFSFLFGFSRKPRVYSQEELAIKDRTNNAFQQSVRRAESSLLVKFVLQKWLDFPPNVMYMNGPQRGDRGGKDLFFIDSPESYGRALLCGLDFDLFVLYAALFAAIDASLKNPYAAMVLTFAVEVVLHFYRVREGLINLSRKTMIDDRFFI
jgi:meckelin